ncbi:MAG: 5'-methylthioadenosine/adenosylhomocysteine nucleosidase [Rhodoferax sp.]
MPQTRPPLAILSALLDEQRGLLAQLDDARKLRHAGRTVWQGHWLGLPVVLALTRVGKVAAATTTAMLIERFGVREVVFTGVAGGVGDGVAVGDVVVATEFIHHDMDSRPLFPRFEIPLYQRSTLPCDPTLTALLLEAAHAGLTSSTGHFHLEKPITDQRLHHGLIASGDRFVASAQDCAELVDALQAAGHTPLAVEMEGAAIAQVCHDYQIAFAAVRTISDRADEQAHVDFSAFVRDVASPYALNIIGNFVELLSKK